MLNDFIIFLKKTGYHFETELKLIKHTACASNIKVIDFEKIKDEFSKKISTSNPLKSVDALYISDSTSSLYFIEMKRKDVSSTKTCKAFVEERFKHIRTKLVDSMFIVLSIIGFFSMGTKFYTYLLDSNKLKCKSILLTDISNQELVTLSLANLDKRNVSLSSLIGSPITLMNCDLFDKYFATI